MNINNSNHLYFNYSCKGCQQEVFVNSTFYELDLNIKGHNTLEECISEYFQVSSYEFKWASV
jgi:hypothetical protein